MTARSGRSRMAAVARWVRGIVAAVALAVLVAGVPWGLAHVVGWPLPDHLPRWEEVGAVLFGPLGSSLLVDILATLTWLVWAVFVLDLLLCLAESVRHLRLPAVSGARPTRALAAVLVTAVAVAVLGNRAPAVTGGMPTAPGHAAPVVATAPMWPDQPPAVHTVAARLAAERAGLPATIVVRAPSGGVYDSLWRVAARSLGDGRRWPEIFELNRGMPQSHGRVFTRPSLVYPGQELRLPGPSRAEAGKAIARDGSPPPASPQQVPSTAEVPAGRPLVAAPSQPWTFDPTLVGAVLAAAAGALLVESVRRSRRRYVPGSGDRHDLQREPVVRELRIRHLRDQQHEPDLDGPEFEDPDLEAVPVIPAAAPPTAEDGWRDDAREIALTLAETRGLGLIGDGAPAAVAALLVTALAGTQRIDAHPAVITTTSCLAALAGDFDTAALPSTVRVVTELADAVDAVEQEILARTGATPAGSEWPPLVLLAEVPAVDDPRLQSVLDNGAQVGVVGLLLGQWLPGVTASVRGDGTVAATSPGLGEHLRGTRLFGLDTVEATTILELLQDTDAEPAPTIDLLDIDPADDDGDPDAPPAAADDSPPQHFTADRSSPAPSSPVPEMPGQARADRPVQLCVFGPPRVLLHGRTGADKVDITARIQPRVRELLVFLALHPAGATREAVAAALWPTSPPDRISNAMNTSLSRLRRAIESETAGTLSQIVRTTDNLLRLDDNIVATDYEAFDAALLARRAATTPMARTDADQAIVDSYGGSLAGGMSTEWIETARASIQRDALDAVAGLARVLVDEDPRRTLDLLEIARAFDPHNEHIYRDIMRLQARLGQPDAVSRTLALLTTRLAEIDDRPAPGTVELAQHLTSADQPSRTRGQATAAV